jgi:DNA polymerase I-like protein with 3'-5' exonuclease and polymerase domains
MPAPGTALAYLDFASMEFGVAAGLSQCPMMLADYDGEPYLTLPQLAGIVPPEATRRSHPDLREQCKAPVLAIQYGGGADLMAQKLHKFNITKGQGQRLVDLHHDRYARYWEWSDNKLQQAFDEGELVTKDGWRCGVSSKTSLHTARNWLIQAIAAAIFRYACLMMRKLGIRIIAVVHDAVLIEASAGRIDQDVVRATLCLERASRRFLRGLKLRVDAKIVREGERLGDKRGTDIWKFFEGALRELDEGTIDAAE